MAHIIPDPHEIRALLREHGVDPGDFWDFQDEDPGPRLFEDFAVRRPTLLMLLRWLFRG